MDAFVKDGATVQKCQIPFTQLLSPLRFQFLSQLVWMRGEFSGWSGVRPHAVKVSAVSDKSSAEKTFPLPRPLCNHRVKKMPAASLIWRDKGLAPNAPAWPPTAE